jgi:glycosyltransferase involved in cell wall biosynthesis
LIIVCLIAAILQALDLGMPDFEDLMLKKILIIAPYADGTDVGEAWSTFQWIKGLSESFEVTVLSAYRRKRSGLSCQLDGVEIVEWPDPPLLGNYERLNSMLKPGYIAFYFSARKWIKKALANGRHWDLVHQISPLALRYPTPALGLGMPYVLGPLAGSIDVPTAFEGEMSSLPWYVRLKAIDTIRLRFDPWLRRSYGESAMIIGVAPYVLERLNDINVHQFSILNETGVLTLPPIKASKNNDKHCFKLLYVGRIVRTKGVRDLIRSLCRLKDLDDIVLDVVGDGEDKAACEAEAKKLDVDNIVTFHGRVSRERVNQFYQDADLFVFPSIKEPSGNVVLEAMSFGLPILAYNSGGPGYTIKEDFGTLVDASTPAEFSQRLAEEIIRLRDIPREELLMMGMAARKEIEENHLWPMKIERLIELYDSLLA